MTQFIKPIGDLLNSTFELVGASTIWEATDDGIDSGTPDDDTTKAAADTVGDFFVVTLSPAMLDPHTRASHILKVRVKEVRDSGAGTVNIRLRQGAVQIVSTNFGLGTAWTTVSITLTNAQADALTNYADLEARVAYSVKGVNGVLHVSAVEFQCPDPSLDSYAAPAEMGHAV